MDKNINDKKFGDVFIQSCLENDLKKVEAFITIGVNVNGKSSDGMWSGS